MIHPRDDALVFPLRHVCNYDTRAAMTVDPNSKKSNTEFKKDKHKKKVPICGHRWVGVAYEYAEIKKMDTSLVLSTTQIRSKNPDFLGRELRPLSTNALRKMFRHSCRLFNFRLQISNFRKLEVGLENARLNPFSNTPTPGLVIRSRRATISSPWSRNSQLGVLPTFPGLVTFLNLI